MKRFMRQVKGATMVEYAVMGALVAIALITLVVGMQRAMGNRFQQAGDRITAGK